VVLERLLLRLIGSLLVLVMPVSADLDAVNRLRGRRRRPVELDLHRVRGADRPVSALGHQLLEVVTLDEEGANALGRPARVLVTPAQSKIASQWPGAAASTSIVPASIQMST